MEKLGHELVEIAMNTADNPALEDRCLKALSKLGSLHLPNQFFHSVGNRIDSLMSDRCRTPAIRKYANRVFTRWMRQLYSRVPASDKPASNLKPQSTRKPLKNPKAGGQDKGEKPQHPTASNTDKSPKAEESSGVDPVERLALELVEIAIETAATVNQPLDDRCIKALLKLSTLDLKSEFIVSSDIANMVDYSLYFNGRLKPLIRGHAARLLVRWTAQLPKPACDLKTRSKTETKAAALSRKRKAATRFNKLSTNVGRQTAVC